MWKAIFGILLFNVSVLLPAQTHSLEDYWRMARENYPLLQGRESLIAASELKVKNIRSTWLPQLEVSGQASWQSDVPHVSGIPSMTFSIPSAPKDQYKIALDVSQTLFDGGRTRLRSKVEAISGDLQLADVEAVLQQVRSTVTQLFFNALMLEAQKKQLEYVSSDLNVRLAELQVAFESGAVLKSTVQALKVERLRIQQKLIALDEAERSLLSSLALFTGQDGIDISELAEPLDVTFETPLQRAEYEKFDLLKSQADAGIMLYGRDRLPVMAAFAQAGYGNPGYNMLQDEFDTFLMVGVKLKWTPWDWKQSRRNRGVLQNQKEWVDYQRQSFELQQQRDFLQAAGETEQYRKMMVKDEEIIQLQSEVTNEYRTQLKLGAITSADYLAELNAEARARLDRDLHRLNYLHSLAQRQQIGTSDN